MTDATIDDGARRTVLTGTLHDGLRVVVTTLVADDRDDVAHGFDALSDRTRYLRFLTAKHHLSQRSLARLVDDVDGHDHVALALWWQRQSTSDVLLGDARFIRLVDDPECADVAVTVADVIQGQGAGTLLMRALVLRARDEGITRFSAVMDPSNEASHRMMLRVGPVLRDVVHDGTREVEVRVPRGDDE